MHRIVVKIGSSSIVDEKSQSIFEDRMESIAEDISWLRRDLETDVVLMSSGALAWGRVCMSASNIHESCRKNQLLAGACGQIGVTAAWASAFQKQGMLMGQLLLTPEDAFSGTVRTTISNMLSHGMVPYINENIPTIEQYDNDGLAADIAQQFECDTLILLSDVDGVYSANPKTDSSAHIIREIDDIDDALSRFGGATSTSLGTGGMSTKLRAAKRMSEMGIRTIIASGEQLNPLQGIVAGLSGTVIKANA